MKKVSELYLRHRGSDIFIIGTGASLRVFPMALLEGRICIGLNDAHRFFSVTYSVTVHPDLYIPDNSKITWITKYDKAKNLLPAEKMRYAEENFYFFESDGRPNTQPPDQPRDEGRMPEWVERPTGDFLYLWSSIAQTAVNLAANLGAKNIFLVGCDQTEILGNAHAHEKPTRWKGADPKLRYRQYFEGLAEVRAALRKRGVNLVSLTPFVGLGHIEDDFKKLCYELKAPEFIESLPDRSPSVSLSEKIGWTIENYAARPVNPQRMQAVLEHAGRSILDVGCGNGAYVLALKDRYDIRGVDSAEYDDWRKSPELFQVSNSERLPFADNSVDTVISFETLEHLPDPLAALKEYRRVCRKNMILSVPDCDVTKGMVRSNLVFSHWRDRTHVQYFNKASIASLVTQAGFRVLRNDAINRISLAPLLAEKIGAAPDGLFSKAMRKASSLSPLRRYYLTRLVVAEK